MPNDKESLYLNFAFSDPLPKQIALRNEPVNNLKVLAEQLDELRTVPVTQYFEAYANLATGQPFRAADKVFEIPYRLGHIESTAFAYLSPSQSNSDCGLLLIPGSGHNKSSEALQHHALGLSGECDVYILIKPNHDYRAIHNDRYKLGRDMIVGGLLRRGYSYSATYLVEALAWAKHLDGQYSYFGVAGQSQGGDAALLVSLQAEPDFAVIASGFSVLQWQVTRAEFDQIVIPGQYKVYSPDRVRAILTSQKTHYFFSYGLQEHLYYGLDATTGASCGFLGAIDPQRIKCLIHDGGHGMVSERVLEFIRQIRVRD